MPLLYIQNAGTITVQRDSGLELCFTNVGQFTVDQAATVRGGSNGAISLSGYHDGTLAVNDSFDTVRLIDGPRVVESVVAGFAIGISIIGVWLVIRSIISRMVKSSGATDYD